MVSPEPGRSSSSPSAKITELKREGADGSGLRVHLDDGSLFLLEASHPAAIQLSVGQSPDAELLESLESASEIFQCRRKALSLLARAEQCRQGLSVKLLKKGYSREAVSQVLEKLSEAGLLDDRRFAESWVRSRLRSRPEGPSRLRGALMAKGVASAVARDAVASVFEELGDEEADKALMRAFEKLYRRSDINEEKLINALVRRGFQFGKIRSLIRTMEKED